MSTSRRRSARQSSAPPGFARRRREMRWCEGARGVLSRHALADETRPLQDRDVLFLAFLKARGALGAEDRITLHHLLAACGLGRRAFGAGGGGFRFVGGRSLRRQRA